MNKSNLELAFGMWIAEYGDIPTPTTQYQFAPPRRWRFDFAWLENKFAVEIQGLKPTGKSGHQSIKGILNDSEKLESALLLGWRVYQVPGPWILKGRTQVYRPQVITTIAQALGVDILE